MSKPGAALRGIIACTTQNIAISIDGDVYGDSLTQPWDRVPVAMQQWYNKVAELTALATTTETIPNAD